MTTDPALLDARAAFDRSAWNDAYAGLTEADGRSPLASEDLERLAIAAYMLGRPDDSTAAGARAHLEAVRTGDIGLAIRSRVLARDGSTCSAARWPRQAAGSPAAARLIEETGYDGVERGCPARSRRRSRP